MYQENEPIIIEQKFRAPKSVVWKAITELDEMKKWYFENLPAFEPIVGFKTGFTVQVEDRVYPHIWEITEVIPESKISYDWEFEGYPGRSNVSFELFEQEGGTLLRFTDKVLKPFPSDVPEFKRESAIAGWNYFIKERLKSYLAQSNE